VGTPFNFLSVFFETAHYRTLVSLLVEEFGLSSKKLDKRVRNLSPSVVGDANSRPLYVLHQPIKIIPRVGDADHPDSRLVPKQARIELSDGNIKRRPEPVFKAARDLPLVLKRVRRFNPQFQGEESDHQQ